MPRDVRIEAEAPPWPLPECIRPAPIARIYPRVTIHTHILATTRTRRGTTQASDLVLDSAGREQCGARLAMGTPTVIRTRTHTDIRTHMDIRTLQYPSSVYVYLRPAPNPPVVVERDQQQPPLYRGDEQAGFGTLSVRVNPPDAVILIDGEVWDRSPGDSQFSNPADRRGPSDRDSEGGLRFVCEDDRRGTAVACPR